MYNPIPQISNTPIAWSQWNVEIPYQTIVSRGCWVLRGRDCIIISIIIYIYTHIWAPVKILHISVGAIVGSAKMRGPFFPFQCFVPLSLLGNPMALQCFLHISKSKVPLQLGSHPSWDRHETPSRWWSVSSQKWGFPSMGDPQNWLLVGGMPTPLKNDGVRQLGWWHSQYMESRKIHVPNHQPAIQMDDLGVPSI